MVWRLRKGRSVRCERFPEFPNFPESFGKRGSSACMAVLFGAAMTNFPNFRIHVLAALMSLTRLMRNRPKCPRKGVLAGSS
jgi:hypothetical protein